MGATSTDQHHTATSDAQAPVTELLRFLTCGSVDDGKSTLIGRLLHDSKMIYDDQLAAVRKDSARLGTTGGDLDLALLTDGLKAEREQGITIDVAYRYFSTERRKFIIADTPGHEQYTRNMATGASTCQLAIILIDARHGVVTQTRRHSYIVSLLGIRHIVVAINKMDLVGHAHDVYERILADYSAFAKRLGITDVRFIPISALKGDNVVDKSALMPWYDGPALLEHLETVPLASDRNLTDMRFPVQYVVRPSMDFRGFAGTVASGVIRRGDEIIVLPSGARSKVRSIVTYDGELDEAQPPMAVTITLEHEIDVSRGDMLAHPDNRPLLSTNVNAMIVWMTEQPLVCGKQYWIKQTTRLATGQIDEVVYAIDVNTLSEHPATELAMNEVGKVRLRLNQPIAHDDYKANRATGALIVIDRLTNNTVGAGMILPPEQTDRPTAVIATNITAHPGTVTRDERQQLLRQRGAILWLTGLSGSGKSTIACLVERALLVQGKLAYRLDGDNLRLGLNRNLGFAADDRAENIRRIGEVARLFADAGVIVIASVISPYRKDRDSVRAAAPADFIEVYIKASLEAAELRDPKGLYKKARAGLIKGFTGIDDRYEAPEHPELIVDTELLSADQAARLILSHLAHRG